MSGFSYVISKSCRLNYSSVTSNEINFCASNKINFGTSSKINFCTSNKINLVLCRLSTMPHQRISPIIAAKPMLKQQVYSSSAGKVVTGLGFKASKVSGTVALFRFLGVLGIVALALLKALEVVQSISMKGAVEGVLKSNAFYYIFLGVTAVYVAICFFCIIMCRIPVPQNKLVSIGDIIEVGQLKGKVVEMGLLTTSLLTEDNRCILFPTSWLNGQDFVNKSRSPSRAMGYEICISLDKMEKIPKISEDIRNMMRSNSVIYLEQEQPFCYLSGLEPLCATLSFGCNLKEVGDCEFGCAEADILAESITIIEKHGAKPAGSFKEVKR